ncbi:MAG TPA: EamA family transporter [Casimicrobiaceae bacterium]|nr:EamA family transporter [Casimicrobiaceae bacterium]
MSVLSRLDTRRGAYVAVVALTLIWGSNWIVMKLALGHAHPIVYNVQRTWLAVVAVFALLVVQRDLAWPTRWWPLVVTGFFQTTVNFGSTTMALAEGGAGRTSVLVFTMPFWTLLLAWPVLHERVRGTLWIAIALASAGLTLVVSPWNWSGDLTPKLWAVLSGFGWAAGSVATKYYLRNDDFPLMNFLAWQMLIGVLPLTPLPWFFDLPPVAWDGVYIALLAWTAFVSIVVGFVLWAFVLRHLPASTASLNMFAIPVIALVSSMLIVGERLTATEWLGIALIAAGLVVLAVRTAAGTRDASQRQATIPRGCD